MNAHDILGVPEGASKEEIKRAYRKKAFQYHPDKNNSESAHSEFIKITEAYEELVEGKRRTKTTYSHTYTYEDVIEKRRRETRERAERYAQMRYEEFQEETDAFKASDSYYFVVVGYFLLVGIFLVFGAAFCIFPFFIAKEHGIGAGIFAGIFLGFIGLAIIKSGLDIYEEFKPYLRDKNYIKPEEVYENKNNRRKKFGFGLPIATFKEYRILKFTLFLPLAFSFLVFLDFLLPKQTSREVITEKNVTRYYNRKGNHVGTEIQFGTAKARFDATTELNVGDTVILVYSPIFKKVDRSFQSNDLIDETTELEHVPTVYDAMIFIVTAIFGLCYLGLASTHENDITATLVISLLLCLMLYVFGM